MNSVIIVSLLALTLVKATPLTLGSLIIIFRKSNSINCNKYRSYFRRIIDTNCYCYL